MEEVLTFLSDERFSKLCLLADRGILLRSDLEQYDMPSGCSRDDVWRALEVLRHQTATILTDEPYACTGIPCWYAMNTAISRITTELELRALAGYPLDRGPHTFCKSPFITKNITKNLHWAFQAEGLDVSEERIEAISGGAEITDDVFDKIIANYFDIKAEEEILAKRDITPGFVEMLHYRLVQDIDPDDLPRRTSASPAKKRSIPAKPEGCLSAVCRLSKKDGTNTALPSQMMRIVHLNWVFCDFEVFSSLSALVGVLLRDILAIKWELPVLKWVPIRYEPENSTRMKEVHDTCWIDTGVGLDFTNVFLVHLDMYRTEVNRLEALVERLGKLDELIQGTFSFPMNKRQLFIMSAVCKDPYARMRIEPHRKLHGVAYSTARKDFFDLEQAGYLVCEQEDKAFVFLANPELRDRIVSLNERAIDLLGGN